MATFGSPRLSYRDHRDSKREFSMWAEYIRARFRKNQANRTIRKGVVILEVTDAAGMTPMGAIITGRKVRRISSEALPRRVRRLASE